MRVSSRNLGLAVWLERMSRRRARRATRLAVRCAPSTHFTTSQFTDFVSCKFMLVERGRGAGNRADLGAAVELGDAVVDEDAEEAVEEVLEDALRRVQGQGRDVDDLEAHTFPFLDRLAVDVGDDTARRRLPRAR